MIFLALFGLESLVFVTITLCILISRALANTRSSLHIHTWISPVAFFEAYGVCRTVLCLFGRFQNVVAPVLN